MKREKVLIAGAGMIGRGWAAAFLRGGMDVVIWSRREQTSREALVYLETCIPDLEKEGVLDGLSATDLLSRVSIVTELENAVADVCYVQESFPEDLATKQEIYARLDSIADPSTIIASSTSALLASQFTEELEGRARCIVAHPINPPYLIPATEVVPAPWTSPETTNGTCEILRAAGQEPVVMSRELDGFIVNRLQGALLNEAFWLVANGYADAESVDTAIKHGLALRWSFMGPFETIDLNAPEGVREYAERYNSIYKRLHAQMRDRADWSGAVLDSIDQDRRAALPMTEHGDRQLWRDRRLMALTRHKRDSDVRLGR